MPLSGTAPLIYVPGGGQASITHGALVKLTSAVTVAANTKYGSMGGSVGTTVFDTDGYFTAFNNPSSADQFTVPAALEGVYYCFGSWSFVCNGTPSLQSYVISGTTYFYGDVTALAYISIGGFNAYLQPMVSTMTTRDGPSRVWTVNWEWLGAIPAGGVVQNPVENDQNVSITAVPAGCYMGLLYMGPS